MNIVFTTVNGNLVSIPADKFPIFVAYQEISVEGFTLQRGYSVEPDEADRVKATLRAMATGELVARKPYSTPRVTELGDLQAATAHVTDGELSSQQQAYADGERAVFEAIEKALSRLARRSSIEAVRIDLHHDGWSANPYDREVMVTDLPRYGSVVTAILNASIDQEDDDDE